MKELRNQHWFGRSPTVFVNDLRALADDLEAIADPAFRPETGIVLNEWWMGQRAVPCLLGRYTGHPTIGDGAGGFSTELLFVDERRNLARTMSRWYRLGSRLDTRRSLTMPTGVQ